MCASLFAQLLHLLGLTQCVSSSQINPSTVDCWFAAQPAWCLIWGGGNRVPVQQLRAWMGPRGGYPLLCSHPSGCRVHCQRGSPSQTSPVLAESVLMVSSPFMCLRMVPGMSCSSAFAGPTVKPFAPWALRGARGDVCSFQDLLPVTLLRDDEGLTVRVPAPSIHSCISSGPSA